MLKIKLLTVGNLKEQYWREAANEYQKRLQRYVQLEMLSIKEERLKDDPSAAEIEQALMKEGQQLMKQLRPTDYVVSLAIQGKEFSSETFAQKFAHWEQSGKRIVFIIGSSYGLAQTIIERSDLQVSFSKMTFPHQMMRIIFLEQLYRSYKILHAETYHK